MSNILKAREACWVTSYFLYLPRSLVRILTRIRNRGRDWNLNWSLSCSQFQINVFWQIGKNLILYPCQFCCCRHSSVLILFLQNAKLQIPWFVWIYLDTLRALYGLVLRAHFMGWFHGTSSHHIPSLHVYRGLEMSSGPFFGTQGKAAVRLWSQGAVALVRSAFSIQIFALLSKIIPSAAGPKWDVCSYACWWTSIHMLIMSLVAMNLKH